MFHTIKKKKNQKEQLLKFQEMELCIQEKLKEEQKMVMVLILLKILIKLNNSKKLLKINIKLYILIINQVPKIIIMIKHNIQVIGVRMTIMVKEFYFNKIHIVFIKDYGIEDRNYQEQKYSPMETNMKVNI